MIVLIELRGFFSAVFSPNTKMVVAALRFLLGGALDEESMTGRIQKRKVKRRKRNRGESEVDGNGKKKESEM